MNTSLNMLVSQIALTAASLEVFTMYADDSENWDGNPWVSVGNVRLTKAQVGNLSDLVQKGLVEIENYDVNTYIVFTDAGEALAESLEIDLGI
jgi:hypothetical protein